MLQSVNGIGERLELAAYLGGKRLWQRLNPGLRRRAHERCVFVAGLQRSGTNLLMEVLERCVETDVYHETDPRAFERYQLRDEATLHRLVSLSSAPVVVIKCLMESQRLRHLLDEFEPARAFWVFRDYRDVVNSMLKSFRNQARQVERVVQGHLEWWNENMTPATLATVRELAAEPLDDVSAAAVQWFFRNSLFFDQGLQGDERVMLLPYEHLVTQPALALDQVSVFAGVSCGARAARIITPASVGKRKPPTVRPDVAAHCDALLERLLNASRS
jgi:hypothetical protein